MLPTEKIKAVVQVDKVLVCYLLAVAVELFPLTVHRHFDNSAVTHVFYQSPLDLSHAISRHSDLLLALCAR